ncbi:MAG: hypothetical protein GY913_20320 [Proteobacteria bacterium]|nr:hypothetical protein [Pseudomonadota bacterium]MCP4919253.1 hypothetical protein [Pseudomonadota bacterium]
MFTPLGAQGPVADEAAWKQKAYSSALSLGWGMAPIEWTRTGEGFVGVGKSNLDDTRATMVWDERGVVSGEMVSHYVHLNYEAWFETEITRLGPDDAPLEPKDVEREALYR